MKYYIGIDNGVTGAVAIFSEEGEQFFFATPVKKEQSYTKAKNMITRVNTPELIKNLSDIMGDNKGVAMIERPMVNPGRFKATMSALRCLEATLVIMEYKGIAVDYIDSKEWQKALLPSGLEKEELKKASADIGKRLFPQFAQKIDKQGDADGLLIAEYCRRKYK
jgi:hypothetical protein